MITSGSGRRRGEERLLLVIQTLNTRMEKQIQSQPHFEGLRIRNEILRIK